MKVQLLKTVKFAGAYHYPGEIIEIDNNILDQLNNDQYQGLKKISDDKSLNKKKSVLFEKLKKLKNKFINTKDDSLREEIDHIEKQIEALQKN